MALELDAVRALFPSLTKLVWMNHGGGAPMHERARAAVQHALGVMVDGSPLDLGEAYAAARTALADGLARLVNVDAADITLTRATAHGLSLVARGLDWREGDNVVSARLEYPSNVYPWMALAAQGVEL